jgi:hypothetical protein
MGMQFTTEDQPDLTLPEDTFFRAQLVEIKPKEIEWTDRKTNEHKTKTLLEWWWEVKSDDQYNGRKIKGECEARLTNHPNNRFHNWSEALLQREIPAGMGIDTDDLVGLMAEITVRWEPDKKDPSKKYERLDEVTPVTAGFAMSDEPPF